MKAFACLSAVCAACVSLVVAIGGSAAPEPCQPLDVLVQISGFAYVPPSVTVAPGTTVCWTNNDVSSHTVTSDSGTFDSGSLGKDDSFRHTFATTGTFPYHCAFPHSMNAQVIVSAGPPPPPPPQPTPPPAPPPAPPSPPPPSPPAPAPQPHVHTLALQGLRISVERSGRKRMLVARARVNRPALARLALLRASRVGASARKPWAAGANTIRATLPRALPRGRWTAELRVGSLRFRRTIRIG